MNNNILDNQLILSDSTFKELRDVIYSLCGIYYTESKKYLLEGRIAKRISSKSLNSFDDYLNLLKSPQSRHEINQLFEAITINETYFFRAEQQFDAFEKIITPELIKSKSNAVNPIVRIWSAASSTGEEAYTIAMLILEKIKPLFPRVQFQILGSDINNAVLDTARKGIYKEYSIRNVPPAYLNKYFTKQGNQYLLNDEVKKMVKFLNLNLYDSVQMRSITNCDIIFCCNVLIYFDIPSKQQVVSYLYDSLNKGGYLFIGYSESLHGISKAFKLIHLPKAMAYKKE
jgi:chemotaxis protein methyltransferase CheR